MSDRAEPLVGRTVLQYRVDRKLGEGGMGAVYLAVQEQMGKKAALKVLHAHLSGDAKSLQRFFNEARATTMVKHPGLVDIYNCGQLEDGLAYILMEFLEGETLADRLLRLRAEGGRLSPDQVVELGAQLASTLAVTHAHGIIHRDLKPENIFIVPDPVAPGGERTKILDFGIAKFRDPSGRKTTVGLVLGTPTYMAPEQCEGREDLSDRVDVYALGVLLYELLAGEAPFVAETASSVMRQHMFKEPRSLAEVAPDVPEFLVELVREMLRKEPARRPSMAEVARRLGSPGAPRRLRRRRQVLLLGAAVLLLLGTGGLLWHRRGVAPQRPTSVLARDAAQAPAPPPSPPAVAGTAPPSVPAPATLPPASVPIKAGTRRNSRRGARLSTARTAERASAPRAPVQMPSATGRQVDGVPVFDN